MRTWVNVIAVDGQGRRAGFTVVLRGKKWMAMLSEDMVAMETFQPVRILEVTVLTGSGMKGVREIMRMSDRQIYT